MPPKRNPLKLNALQLKMLTIIQALTEPDEANSEERPISMLPPAHGNHFHVGPHLVMGSDATGLHNAAVWAALNRKGLVIGQPPGHSSLTAAGIAYETGMAEKILNAHDH